MRSSRSRPDPLDPGPAGFAHRGLHTGSVPENSMSAFTAAIDAGAGIECDLRLTTDDHIIVFHDSEASRMCGTLLDIGRAPLDKVRKLRVGDEPIPTLRELLERVAGEVPLLLEIKVERDIWRWPPALASTLAGYRGRVGVMSFDPRIARAAKAVLPGFPRGLVIRDSLSPVRRGLAMRLADPQFLAVDRTSLEKPWVERARRRIPVYSWTIRSAEERAQAAVHADALIWEGDGRPRI
jgi:glycerophosphoryl diester phosphodiesterase